MTQSNKDISNYFKTGFYKHSATAIGRQVESRERLKEHVLNTIDYMLDSGDAEASKNGPDFIKTILENYKEATLLSEWILSGE